MLYKFLWSPEIPTFVNSFTSQGATVNLTTVRVRVFEDYELSVFRSSAVLGASFEIFENINDQFYLKYGALIPLGVSLSMGYMIFKDWFLFETSNLRFEYKTSMHFGQSVYGIDAPSPRFIHWVSLMYSYRF